MTDKTLNYCLPSNEIGAETIAVSIVATDKQRKELAERFGIIDIESLKSHVEISYSNSHKAYVVRGHVSSDVVQPCVVSLDPVHEKVDCDFEVLVVSEEQANTWDRDEKYLDETFPDYDTMMDDTVAVGEIVAQTVSIHLNPFPRGEGVVLRSDKDFLSVNEGEIKRDNPFAKLTDLKSRLRDKS